MNTDHINIQTKVLIAQDFELQITEDYDLEQSLAERIADMMNYELENLFNILYRMDVTEDKIKYALNPNNSEMPHLSLARIIIERQKQRVKTRLEYPQKGEPFFK